MQNYLEYGKVGSGKNGMVVLVEALRGRLAGEKLCMKKIDITNMSEEDVRTIEKEADTLFNLSHREKGQEAIVKYRDSFRYSRTVGRERRKYFAIVMDYAEHGDLKHWLAKRATPLDEPWALEFFAEICLAILHCHLHKVLHRDLRPANIYVTLGLRLRVGDFGSSKLLDMTMGNACTMTNSCNYRAPEICDGQSYSYAADVWALGCILYELCTGYSAFRSSDVLSMNRAIMSGELPSFPDHMSAEVRQLIASCLALQPGARPGVQQVLQTPIMQVAVGRYWRKVQDRDRIRGLDLIQPGAPAVLAHRPSASSKARDAMPAMELPPEADGSHIDDEAPEPDEEYQEERRRATSTPDQAYSGLEFEPDAVNNFTKQRPSSGAAAFF